MKIKGLFYWERGRAARTERAAFKATTPYEGVVADARGSRVLDRASDLRSII